MLLPDQLQNPSSQGRETQPPFATYSIRRIERMMDAGLMIVIAGPEIAENVLLCQKRYSACANRTCANRI